MLGSIDIRQGTDNGKSAKDGEGINSPGGLDDNRGIDFDGDG